MNLRGSRLSNQCITSESRAPKAVRRRTSYGVDFATVRIRRKELKRDRSKLAFQLSLLAAAFAYGVACAHWELFPYPTIVAARAGVAEIVAHWKSYVGTRPTRWISQSRRSGAGVTIAKANRYQSGLIFVSTFLDGEVTLALLDADGAIRHRWPVRYLDLWSRAEQVSMGTQPLRNWDIGVMGAVLLPDGSVVFSFNNSGLVKLDWCGRLVWKHAYPTHHSVFVSEDGTIWVATVKALHTSSVPDELRPLHAPLVEDAIAQLDAEGREMRVISIPRLLLRNHLESLLLANGATTTTNLTADYTHLNRVVVLQSVDVARFPMFAVGDVLISLRNLNLVVVIDPATELVKWAQLGPWLRQHDAKFAPDGRISVFDNHSDNTGGRVFGGSRIVKIDPKTRTEATIYGGVSASDFYSETEGEHVYLANGNLLISESTGGRIFEIDPSGEIVWEFVNRYDAGHVVAETLAYAKVSGEHFNEFNAMCRP
jgi:arylsulfotransferase ASST